LLWLQVAFALLIVSLVASMAIGSFGRAKSPPPPPQPAESSHMVLRDAMLTKYDSFDRRWQPISPPLAAADVEVHDTLPRETQGPSKAVADEMPVAAVVAGRAPSPRHRSASDVCARHGMHRVNYTKPNGWKFWRCR
jgi:hypothetical protein